MHDRSPGSNNLAKISRRRANDLQPYPAAHYERPDPMLSPALGSRLSIAALVLALASAGTAAAQGPVAWKLTKGDKLTYQFIQKNDIKVTVNGQDIKNVTTLDVELAWEVQEVAADGKATVGQTIQHARVELTTPNGPVVYDSKKKAEDPATQQIAKIYDNVIGEKYILVLTPAGEVTSVTVPEKVAAAVKGSPFEALADSGSLLSSKGVQKMMAQVLPKLSEKATAKGATWNGSLELPAGPIQMTLDTAYTLSSLEGAKAEIDGKIDTKIAAGPGSPLTVKVNKQTGDSKFKLDGGKLVSSTIKQVFDMTLGVNNQEIAQVINIDAAMTLKP
ncbi:MAG: DUF6263 family protein [Isosphaeraceae bacterium]|nr:DUF6263 family protein [Isosphaeraceae bacterium]